MDGDIKLQVKKEVDSLGESFFSDEGKRRNEVSQEMQRLLEKSNLLNGGILTSPELCDSIKIQKKIHNINPIILPKLVGNYHYNVNFKAYIKSEEEFIKEHPEYSGTSGHPGVDIDEFSRDLSNLLKAKGNDFFGAFVKFRTHPGVGIAILSGYLYLFNPEKYPLINDAAIGGMEYFIGKQHGSLIKKFAEQEKKNNNITLPIKDATLRKYLAWSYLLKEMLDIDGINSFHAIDVLSWSVNKKSKKDHYFAISFGEKDIARWDNYLQNGYHAIGWDKINQDLSGMSEGEIEEAYKEAYPEFSVNKRAAQMYSITRFINLEKGDKIIANLGKGEILAVGEVISGYYFEREAPSYKHRVRVKWTDIIRRKIPEQSGWANTLKVLSQGLFNDLVSFKGDPKPVEDNCFTREMFEWFEGLHKNQTKEYFDETKFQYNQFVNTPFKNLVKKIANQLDPQMLVKLETEKRVRSNILKNDFGIGSAYDYLWFAFYPKGSSRIKDSQLFCWVNKDEVRYGFYIGEYGKIARDKFNNNINKNKEEFIKTINKLKDIRNLKFYYKEASEEEKINENELSFPVNTHVLEEWLAENQKGIVVIIDKEEAIKRGDLSTEIATAFKMLFPIWLYAVSEDIESEIQPPGEEELVVEEYSKDNLITETNLEEKDVNDIVSTLERKKNIVFYGPPGTGKTFIAQKVAQYLVEGRKDNIAYVQFHQSYAYEDFIEGIRPVSKKDGGGNHVIDYPVKPGIFKLLCERASIYTKQKFVILIDEFNRGNVSKIFGELQYLLEYRNSENSIMLPYSKEELYIPDNIHIIATMNTADRSLTHIDFAMRRRFSFIRFDVNMDILLKWGQQNDLIMESLISVLEDINDKIGDDNYYLGISYFMKKNLPDIIENVWKYEIHPYIKEYFINDDNSKADDFSWEKVKPKLQDLLS